MAIFKGNLEKFTQHSDLKEKLINTGKKHLVEASPFDKIWGIGMDANHPDATNIDKWNGQNLLGEVIMSVRLHLQNE